MPFGLNLLLEFSFIFIVLCKSDVVPTQLKSMVIHEY
jgi:hypothetical protein